MLLYVYLQVLSESGSSEVINKMYDTALEKCETYKEERDDLKDQQSDMMAQVNATKAKLVRADLAVYMWR